MDVTTVVKVVSTHQKVEGGCVYYPVKLLVRLLASKWETQRFYFKR